MSDLLIFSSNLTILQKNAPSIRGKHVWCVFIFNSAGVVHRKGHTSLPVKSYNCALKSEMKFKGMMKNNKLKSAQTKTWIDFLRYKNNLPVCIVYTVHSTANSSQLKSQRELPWFAPRFYCPGASSKWSPRLQESWLKWKTIQKSKVLPLAVVLNISCTYGINRKVTISPSLLLLFS